MKIMKTIKEKIQWLLQHNLTGIYCDTCKFEDDEDGCESCDRKAMEWKPSEEFIEKLTDDILKNIGDLEERATKAENELSWIKYQDRMGK